MFPPGENGQTDDLKELEHRLAGAIVFEAAVFPDDREVVLQRLLIFPLGGKPMGEIECVLQILRLARRTGLQLGHGGAALLREGEVESNLKTAGLLMKLQARREDD
ncbi:MAG: hypothetical protein MPW15_25530 [Candidatus Manganitrophus sp.]|nr:hypothetical protein [Candidatus Manganitrophus sp.]